jgi:hypothetical protein
LTKAHFTALADEIQMKPGIVLKTVTDLSRKILTVSETAPAQFKTRYESIDMVDRIDTILRHHAVSMLDVLA